MSLHRSLLPLALALSVVAAACSATPETLASTEDLAEVESSEQVSNSAVSLDGGNDQIDDDAENARTIGDQSQQSTTTAASTDTTASKTSLATSGSTEPTMPAPTCVAPDREPRWVDVAIDDPDGGLNVRNGAGTGNAVVFTAARGNELISLGDCETVGTTDWWKVTATDGSRTGWASSRFLSNGPVFTPGLGAAFNDSDNRGATGETLEEMATVIAKAYGFDADLVLTQVGEVDGFDAQGGAVVYDMSGLKDDSTGGYRVEINFRFEKTDDANEVIGFTAIGITTFPQCTRGVSPDGLCI